MTNRERAENVVWAFCKGEEGSEYQKGCEAALESLLNEVAEEATKAEHDRMLDKEEVDTTTSSHARPCTDPKCVHHGENGEYLIGRDPTANAFSPPEDRGSFEMPIDTARIYCPYCSQPTTLSSSHQGVPSQIQRRRQEWVTFAAHSPERPCVPNEIWVGEPNKPFDADAYFEAWAKDQAKYASLYADKMLTETEKRFKEGECSTQPK